MRNLKAFFQTYKHGLLPIIYGVFYFIVYIYLEHREVASFHMLNTAFDERIPFCEYFILPYYLWFPYIAFSVAAFIFLDKEKKDYYKLCFILGFGMTFFLIFSYVYPNAIALRPENIARTNIFVTLTNRIYLADTATNVFPSIHCFNSLAVCFAFWHSHIFRQNRLLLLISTLLCCLIILSTMFVKQHSIVDVLGSFLLFFLLYLPVYVFPAIFPKHTN